MSRHSRYVLYRRWLGEATGGPIADVYSYSNRKAAVAAAEKFKDVALVAAQKVVDTRTGYVLWKSNGWDPAWEPAL